MMMCGMPGSESVCKQVMSKEMKNIYVNRKKWLLYPTTDIVIEQVCN